MKLYPLQFTLTAILVTLSSLISPSAFGQLTVLTSDTIQISGSATQFELVGYGRITNTGTAPLNVRWKRVNSQLPSSWTCTICDLNFCFPPSVDSADFILPAQDTAKMDGHFYPNNQSGSGYQRISLRNLANPSVIHFITYIGSTMGSGQFMLTHTGNDVDWKQIGGRLWISIPDDMVGNTLQILDISGKIVLSQMVAEPVHVTELQGLPAGVYIANLANRGHSSVVHRFYWQP